MEKDTALKLLDSTLSEVVDSRGAAKVDDYMGLREVDAKVRDVRMILECVDGLPKSLIDSMAVNIDFGANSRRVRLEALAGYIRSATKFLATGSPEKPKKVIHAPPNFQPLTGSVPGLTEEIDKRWREAQKCAHVGAFTAAVIIMGSILEGLLLARAQQSAAIAYQSKRVPKDRQGNAISIPNWKLTDLIDVAADVGWIKTDRAKFGHALRDSRNVVHPWQAVMTGADFDSATCMTSWSVLDASADDLLRSLKP